MTPVHTVAWQDVSCLERLKFRYRLPHAATADIAQAFPDASVQIRPFSQITPRARDLMQITQPDQFRLDVALGDTTLLGQFDGDPNAWPLDVLRDVGSRLQQAGFGPVSYRL